MPEHPDDDEYGAAMATEDTERHREAEADCVRTGAHDLDRNHQCRRCGLWSI